MELDMREDGRQVESSLKGGVKRGIIVFGGRDSGIKTRNIKSLGKTIVGLRSSADALNILVDENRWNTQAIKDGLPTAVGLSGDPSFAARGTLGIVTGYATEIMKASAYGMDVSADRLELKRELEAMKTEIKIDKAEFKKEIQQWLHEIEDLFRDEMGLRLDIFKAKEDVRLKGERLRRLVPVIEQVACQLVGRRQPVGFQEGFGAQVDFVRGDERERGRA